MDYPEYAEVNGRKYKINTDFRTAIECDEIARREINDVERALAIVYKLFGDEGLENDEDIEGLLKISKKYLSCGKELEKTKEEPDMEFTQDMPYIRASFMSDFNIDLNKEHMHWWEFNELLNGLSYSEMGNCCILNRIREIRRKNPNDIKKAKDRDEFIKMQNRVALKKKEDNRTLTSKQEESVKEFYKQAGIEWRDKE